MPRSSGKQQRTRGTIDKLPSGQFRVRVYAGQDPLTGKRHDLVELAPTAAAAEKVRTKLLSQLDERRNARTKATVNKLMDRHLEVLDVDDKTRATYEGYINNHVRPALGKLQLGQLDGEILDSFYAQLRRCRNRCRAKGVKVTTDHRTTRPHDCDDRCTPTQVPADECGHHPPDPLDPVRRYDQGCALALDHVQPDRRGPAAGGHSPESDPALARGRRADPQRRLG
jgi:integrase